MLRACYIITDTIGAYERFINVLVYFPIRRLFRERVSAMIVTHEREKLIQAINFFAQQTRKLGKTKLFKLLYFLDFQHFQATGRSVTGLDYNAWKMGPVPVALFEEIGAPGEDMAAVVEFREKPINDGAMLTVNSQSAFSDEHFSKRELALLRALASEYRDATADEMIEATHLENLPWHKVWNEQGAKQAEIPYELAVRPDEVDLVKRVVSERSELLQRLR